MIFLNINKNYICTKQVPLLTISIALCVCLAGCSFITDLFSDDSIQQQSNTTAPLLDKIPEPDKTSFSYSAITNTHIKNLYAQIEDECQKTAPTEIQCTGELTQKDIYEAIIAFKNDHPDVFWLGNKFTYYSNNGYTYVELTFITTGAELEKQQQIFSDAVSDFVENATKYSSEYEREKYVNDYIISNCSYDDEAAKNNYQSGNAGNTYGVLVEKKAICEGYARTFQLLCNEMGIQCVSVAGMTDNIGHEWNCAYIEGNWYHIDVTWNDTENDVDKYAYFNLTDEQMYSSHRVDDLFSKIDADEYNNDENLIGNLFVPQCTATEYNYYQQTAPTLYGFDDENDQIITEALAKAALNKEPYFSIIIDSSLDFDEAYSKLVNDAYVVNYIEDANDLLWGETELNTTSYAYKNKNLNVMTIELSYIY